MNGRHNDENAMMEVPSGKLSKIHPPARVFNQIAEVSPEKGVKPPEK